jgi:hypothetical protein
VLILAVFVFAGPTLLTAAVRLLGGPLAYIPPSLLTAVRKTHFGITALKFSRSALSPQH